MLPDAGYSLTSAGNLSLFLMLSVIISGLIQSRARTSSVCIRGYSLFDRGVGCIGVVVVKP